MTLEWYHVQGRFLSCSRLPELRFKQFRKGIHQILFLVMDLAARVDKFIPLNMSTALQEARELGHCLLGDR